MVNVRGSGVGEGVGVTAVGVGVTSATTGVWVARSTVSTGSGGAGLGVQAEIRDNIRRRVVFLKEFLPEKGKSIIRSARLLAGKAACPPQQYQNHTRRMSIAEKAGQCKA
jgi:hypothetical protein